VLGNASLGCDEFPAPSVQRMPFLLQTVVDTKYGGYLLEKSQRLLLCIEQTEAGLTFVLLMKQARASDTGKALESAVWEAHARCCKILRDNNICIPTRAQSAVLARRLKASLLVSAHWDKYFVAAKEQMLRLSASVRSCLEACFESCSILLRQLEENQDYRGAKKNILIQSRKLRAVSAKLINDSCIWFKQRYQRSESQELIHEMEPALTRFLQRFHKQYIPVPELGRHISYSKGYEKEDERGHFCGEELDLEEELYYWKQAHAQLQERHLKLQSDFEMLLAGQKRLTIEAKETSCLQKRPYIDAKTTLKLEKDFKMMLAGEKLIQNKMLVCEDREEEEEEEEKQDDIHVHVLLVLAQEEEQEEKEEKWREREKEEKENQNKEQEKEEEKSREEVQLASQEETIHHMKRRRMNAFITNQVFPCSSGEQEEQGRTGKRDCTARPRGLSRIPEEEEDGKERKEKEAGKTVQIHAISAAALEADTCDAALEAEIDEAMLPMLNEAMLPMLSVLSACGQAVQRSYRGKRDLMSAQETYYRGKKAPEPLQLKAERYGKGLGFRV